MRLLSSGPPGRGRDGVLQSRACVQDAIEDYFEVPFAVRHFLDSAREMSCRIEAHMSMRSSQTLLLLLLLCCCCCRCLQLLSLLLPAAAAAAAAVAAAAAAAAAVGAAVAAADAAAAVCV